VEKKVKRVRLQLERESRVAYSHIGKWLSRGATSVPTWMASNKNFKRNLAKIKDGSEYFLMLKKYGRQYILNQCQCRMLMGMENEKIEKIERMVKVG
jgi:hypothetical protein